MEAGALGWLVCIGKVCSKVGPLILSRTGYPWEGQSLQASMAPSCQSIRIWKITGMLIPSGCQPYWYLPGLLGGPNTCSTTQSRNVSLEDKDEKRGLRRSCHLPGVPLASQPAQSWVWRRPGWEGPVLGWQTLPRPAGGPCHPPCLACGPAWEGSGFPTQLQCPYLKGKCSFSSVPS